MWLYSVGDSQTVSVLFGVIELITAALLALRSFAPRLSFVGSATAFVMFLPTVSFLVTTGDERGGGFLIKDLVCLGVALWTGEDSLDAFAAMRTGGQMPATPVR